MTILSAKVLFQNRFEFCWDILISRYFAKKTRTNPANDRMLKTDVSGYSYLYLKAVTWRWFHDVINECIYWYFGSYLFFYTMNRIDFIILSLFYVVIRNVLFVSALPDAGKWTFVFNEVIFFKCFSFRMIKFRA